MGWPGGPDAKYLWREGAKPAEAQYANIAATISQFEPVQLLANPGQVQLLFLLSCAGSDLQVGPYRVSMLLRERVHHAWL